MSSNPPLRKQRRKASSSTNAISCTGRSPEHVYRVYRCEDIECGKKFTGKVLYGNHLARRHGGIIKRSASEILPEHKHSEQGILSSGHYELGSNGACGSHSYGLPDSKSANASSERPCKVATSGDCAGAQHETQSNSLEFVAGASLELTEEPLAVLNISSSLPHGQETPVPTDRSFQDGQSVDVENVVVRLCFRN